MEMDWETVACQEVCPHIRVLLIEREVEARLAAVEEIKESTNYKLEDVASLLTRLPDLEKGLVRIHYGRVQS
jgi:DNA mismatch repair ATPase MutS